MHAQFIWRFLKEGATVSVVVSEWNCRDLLCVVRGESVKRGYVQLVVATGSRTIRPDSDSD